MGSPMNGDIYEGQLRPGDVGLTKEEADRFKESSVSDRVIEFRRRFQEHARAWIRQTSRREARS